MSWIKQQEEFFHKMQEKREEENPKYIDLYFYYISKGGMVTSVKKQRFFNVNEDVDDKDVLDEKMDGKKCTYITAEKILYIIHQRKKRNYFLDEILLYEYTSGGSSAAEGGANENGTLKQIPITVTDIELKPSLFIFHDVNSIFFIFRWGGGNQGFNHSSHPSVGNIGSYIALSFYRRTGKNIKKKHNKTRRIIYEDEEES